MKLFPAFLPLDGKSVLIVGGGELASRKARLVWAEGVSVEFIAPRFESGVEEEWADRATFNRRAPRVADFESRALIFVAEEDETQAESYGRLARQARRGGAPLNIVDIPAASDFFTPSIVDREEVVVAISTGGTAPVLGQKIRGQLEQLLPARLGALARFAQAFRPAVAANIEPRARRRFWQRIFGGPVASLVLDGEEAAAREQMISLVNAPDTDTQNGIVHIVGAGPGDPELLTLRGHRLLQEADVIVYDRLVSAEILSLARRDADRIYVGKAKADHAVPQEDIEQILIDQARGGKIVVRLKGGDPFIFGRGGEEVDTVKAAGIEVQVTPGITAAAGCAASSLVPLTHRDHAQSVTFITGHAKGDQDPDLNWQALAASGSTLVFYMGVSKARTISERLIGAGLAGATPVAVIENGTRLNERILLGSLGDLGGLIQREGIEGPAILLIGDVATKASPGQLDEIIQNVATRRTA
ncbi:MAG: siroheme synthase CysG [Pseudomonadota bacterium]